MRLAAVGVVLIAASAVGQQRPRWAGFEGVSIGAPIDDLLALGGECRSVDATGELGPNTSAYWFSQSAFQYALPHYHPPRDSSAAHVALRLGTMCVAPLLDARARMVAAAIDRRVVAIVVWFEGTRDDRLTPDSVRRIARVAWGQPTHPAANLDTWWGTRYRSYVLIPRVGSVPPEWAAPRIIVLDIAACTAFDRRMHRAGAQGEAGEC
jgi:hypothetical protein